MKTKEGHYELVRCRVRGSTSVKPIEQTLYCIESLLDAVNSNGGDNSKYADKVFLAILSILHNLLSDAGKINPLKVGLTAVL